MTRVVEVRVYSLKPGKRGEFHALVMSASLPMLRRWGADVIAVGPSLDGENDYHLVRAYASIEALRSGQEAFYASDEWRQGPREAILALIESYAATVIELDERLIAQLRSAFMGQPPSSAA